MKNHNTFHAGELEAQRRAGAGDVANWAADFIRDHMPQQHRDFHTSLPFIIVSAADADGRPWVTILEGEDGFITSPNAQMLALNTMPHPSDPLATAITSGTEIGLIGIELATRRRNRLSGTISANDGQLTIAIRQTFGNCPQYIRERRWLRTADNTPGAAAASSHLTDRQKNQISQADTMFIGTGQRGDQSAPSDGFDASHRGGRPGFVQIVDERHLRIPDYAGNNYFNTIGNLIKNPRIGLLFIDFDTGSLLHISGTAAIDWEPVNASDPAARRMIDVTIGAVVERPQALSLRWEADPSQKRVLVVADKVRESTDVTSLYLYPADRQPCGTFEAGQHLPITLNVSGRRDGIERSYSLSNSPADGFYRISVKREAQGLASRLIHDALKAGDVIRAGTPSGDFVVPCRDCPLVLVSAGIGITPMVSMLRAAVQGQHNRPIWFVHGARDGQHHSLREEVNELIALNPVFHRVTHYSQPLETDRMGEHYDASGRITPEALINLGAGSDTHYLLCGPPAFLSDIQSGLETRGIPTDQIHFETFGPVGTSSV